MAPMPKRNDPVDCTECGMSNDVERGGTQCIWCHATLPDPWGGDYIRTNPPKKKGGKG